MPTLKGKVAVVVGASRGAGRGIAVSLGEAGAIVYVAARTSRNGPKPPDGAPGSVEDTAEEIMRRGGTGIAVRADMSDEVQAAALFERVSKEQGRLDVLALSPWGPDTITAWSTPFEELDSSLWRDLVETLSAHWFASVHAARLMRKKDRGLIAMVTDNYPDEHKYRGQILHDLGHEFINRLILGMSTAPITSIPELWDGPRKRRSGIAVLGLNPGFMRTERVLMSMTSDEIKRQFRFDLSETVEYVGRAVVALAADPDVILKNGALLWVCDVAKEYGFTDTDGRYIPRFDQHAPVQPFPS